MIFTILHLAVLPAVMIAAAVNGLVPIAVIDGAVFLTLFAVEAMLWPVRLRLPRVHMRRVAQVEPR